MISRKYTKYIFLLVAIANAVFQLIEKPIKFGNWISAVGFLVLSIMFLISESRKNTK